MDRIKKPATEDSVAGEDFKRAIVFAVRVQAKRRGCLSETKTPRTWERPWQL
jgi:hypothetical protein